MSQKGGDLLAHFARRDRVALSVPGWGLVVWPGRNSVVAGTVPGDDMVPGRGGLRRTGDSRWELCLS